MNPAMTIRLRYAAAATLLLAVELFIALLVDDAVVRPFVGDSLAVMLVYCGLRATFRMRACAAVLAALAIASAIEVGQLFGLLDLLGLRASPVARVVLGTGFDPLDFLAYAAGAICAVTVEHVLSRRAAGQGAAPSGGPG